MNRISYKNFINFPSKKHFLHYIIHHSMGQQEFTKKIFSTNQNNFRNRI